LDLSFQIDNNWTPSKIAQKLYIMYNWKLTYGSVGIGTIQPARKLINRYYV